MQKSLLIHDPVHKTIILDEFEQMLVNTRHVQRLRNIQQLGLVDTVYPGANHTRFEHSIGTMHMASVIGTSLGLEPDEIRMVRAAGLLHDVGHSAFSHVVEGVLKRNPSLQPDINGNRLVKHEAFTRDIISRSLPEDTFIARYVEKEFGSDPHEFFGEIAKIATGDTSLKKPYLAQVIADDVDADRIDFMLRDSYHTGVSFGMIDVDQIVRSLVIRNENIVLGSPDGSGYGEDMALTAAESLLISRAHHYTAIIHNPKTQASRVMLLYALEDALGSYEKKAGLEKAREEVVLFFKTYNDTDLLDFIRSHASEKSLHLLADIRDGNIYAPVARLSQKTIPPSVRMALSTIARHGVATKKLESLLSRKLGDVLVDLSVASGIPKSMRISLGKEDAFFYDESALANGLVRAISRQLSLTAFAHPSVVTEMDNEAVSLRLREAVDDLSPKLLHFIRTEQYLPIEGVMLLFYGVHSLFEDKEDGFLSIPRLRHITWLYRTIRQLRGSTRLRNLFDYSFHEKYGFPYSDRLFEDIQILVAMGIVDEDLRYYEKGGRFRQSYEYVLTWDGVEYARMLADAYRPEFEEIRNYLVMNKHSIPRDIVTIPANRYVTKKR
ncbi:HD domain-containing protein [Methanolobus chelungpuianus]|uniref:Metal-dependent phosphohydrolase n=1 Tax=Methanolobus chelungpuianus TaxID=502115 RepID=A0AAE3KZT8_9EURY|nr:HD domain-containing protein [Methanolobus chelungpuianus]MCQ6962693.1 metal-dependent phosphohydrolase [Methanolobus chelungpuianus]